MKLIDLFLIIYLYIFKRLCKLFKNLNHFFCSLFVFIHHLRIPCVWGFRLFMLNLLNLSGQCFNLLSQQIDFSLHFLCVFILLMHFRQLLKLHCKLFMNLKEFLKRWSEFIIFCLQINIFLSQLFKLTFSREIVLKPTLICCSKRHMILFMLKTSVFIECQIK